MKIVRIILTIVFGWSFTKNLDLILRPESLDRGLFDAANLTWLFFLLMVATMACQAIGIVWVWKPFSLGYLFAFGAILLGLTETSIGTAVAMQRPEVAKELIVASRESRGLSVNQSVLDLMDNPAVQLAPVATSLVLGAVWSGLIVLLIWTNRAKPEPAAQMYRPPNRLGFGEKHEDL